MSVTSELFERWKASKRFPSDRAALDALGLSPGAAVHWKSGRQASAAVLEKMCADTGDDFALVLIRAWEEAARDAADKRALQRLTKRFRGAALALALGALPLMAPSATQAGSCGLTSYSLCEHRSASRRMRRDSGSLRGPSRKRRRSTWKSCPPAFKCSA
jgi:hypothetical protein